MFRLGRIIVGFALLAYVGSNVRDIKNRMVNHEAQPFYASSVSSPFTGALDGLKEMASQKSGRSNRTNADYISTPSNYSTNQSTAETACGYYSDECK